MGFARLVSASKSLDRGKPLNNYENLISNLLKLVRVEGLEPPRLTAPEPKSGASTNFATPASDRHAIFPFFTKRKSKLRE